MLLDKKYTIIPSIKFSLTYDNGVRKVITVKTKDKIDCSYRKDGERCNIVGIVTKIGCNFNSSLGTVGTTAYLQIDGSTEYAGQVEYIQPEQILDITILSTSGSIDNVVCSVDNEDQKISLIRENEVGVFQYSMDGITWVPVSGSQGMSAYECAVKCGFVGTEEEWLESLKGEPGEVGGGMDIFKVYTTEDDAIVDRDNVPNGKLIVVTYEDIPNHNPILYSRKKCSCTNCDEDNCVCECGEKDIKGYEYIGNLTVGPAGKQGNPGKSAYEMAVEGGFPGTESEFVSTLANSAVPVTNNYTGPVPNLKNTVVGPMDLRLFGFTDCDFRSKVITKIDVTSPDECEDQTVLFRDGVVLRAIPTESSAAKPNVVINGKKYVSDCIMNNAGKVGVLRRVEYIDSYNGETIIGDWISSTGELDFGAKVQYVINGRFEPFDENLQEQYRKLHTYNGTTNIITNNAVYVSVSYAIELITFIDDAIDHKQDKLIAGDNIFINPDNNRISTPGAVFEEDFTTTMDIGGLDRGTNIKKGDKIGDILMKMLRPYVEPEKRCVYWGGTDLVPRDLEGLDMEPMEDEVLLRDGVTHAYTLDDQYPVFAYKKANGVLRSIKDQIGFENINGWNHVEYNDAESGTDFYIYYSEEPLTIEDYSFTFSFKK